jgi:hypothetical protein
MRRSFLALLLLLFTTSSATARATEVQVASGPVANASSWRGDGSVSQSLKLGLRFKEFISIDALTRLGYATVDDRVLTYLSLGSTIYARIGHVARPYVRLALVHQHEEPTSAWRNDVFGALFGVGDGIRHRGGFGSSLGCDFIVHRGPRTELVLGLDANGTWFPDPRGPNVYYGGGLWAGLNYGL